VTNKLELLKETEKEQRDHWEHGLEKCEEMIEKDIKKWEVDRKSE